MTLRTLLEEIRRDGVRDERVLEALARVPRERFVPSSHRGLAHGNHPLPIACEQTISQPTIVAMMTELAELQPGDRVLEVGTGSGYQTAVLAEMLGLGAAQDETVEDAGSELVSLEILPELASGAGTLLKELGYRGLDLRLADGHRGCPERAPFDAIVVTAAPARLPMALADQLAERGRLVIPVGVEHQELLVITKIDGATRERRVIPVRFVPMTGES
ncbi:MAG: protein-L-isoaspartate(D-aspartate) O-methyltransferase [Acidobacteriota bacterium]